MPAILLCDNHTTLKILKTQYYGLSNLQTYYQGDAVPAWMMV